MAEISENKFSVFLYRLLVDAADKGVFGSGGAKIGRFKTSGIISDNAGVVIEIAGSGLKFELTIVESADSPHRKQKR